MELSKKIELGIAVFSAIAGREVLAWAVKRFKNRGEISAEVGKINAETKSIEVKTLSEALLTMNEGMQRLDAKVVALELELEKSRRNENECLKRGREQDLLIARLQSEIQMMKFRPAR